MSPNYIEIFKNVITSPIKTICTGIFKNSIAMLCSLALLLKTKLTSRLVEHDELGESSLGEFAPIGGLSLPKPNQVVAGWVEQLLPELIVVPPAEIGFKIT